MSLLDIEPKTDNLGVDLDAEVECIGALRKGCGRTATLLCTARCQVKHTYSRALCRVCAHEAMALAGMGALFCAVCPYGFAHAVGITARPL